VSHQNLFFEKDGNVLLDLLERRGVDQVVRGNTRNEGAVVGNDDPRRRRHVGIQEGPSLPIDQANARAHAFAFEGADHFAIHRDVLRVVRQRPLLVRVREQIGAALSRRIVRAFRVRRLRMDRHVVERINAAGRYGPAHVVVRSVVVPLTTAFVVVVVGGIESAAGRRAVRCCYGGRVRHDVLCLRVVAVYYCSLLGFVRTAVFWIETRSI